MDERSAVSTGLSLAASALQAGRAMLTRSFRLHRPRGAFCHRGWCQQCKVQLDDGRIVLACQTFGVSEAHQRPPLPLYRLIARFSESLPPWFYERRLRWPRRMRQFYLNTLRRLSAALPLPPAPEEAAAQAWHHRDCDALVVGGGLAGLTAAGLLANAGRNVLLVEAERLGGSARYDSTLAADLDEARTKSAHVTSLEGTVCVGLYDDASRALCIGPDGPVGVSFRELVVATGAYDRLLPFIGSDLPGIIGVRAFERLAHHGALSAQTIGIYAHPDEAVRALAVARRAGLAPVWLAGPDALPKADCPSYPNALIVCATGARRVRRVELSNGKTLACDLLVLGFTQPTYELQAQAGASVVLRGPLPVIATEGDTIVPILVVGEAAGASDPRAAMAQSAAATAALLAGQRPTIPQPTSPASQTMPSAPDAAFVCLCEDVRFRDVRQAVQDGFNDIELVKRRTGAGTGPCQGKLCHAELLRCVSECGVPARLPTMRPLIRPVPLGAFRGNPDA